MRLTLPEPEIPEIGGFTAENDLFGYHDFADRLANLVQNIDEPLVIALDGPWGSGKSVFAKQWAGLLRERGAPVIHFDAFGNDHHEDAFLALSGEIHATAKKALGGNEPTTRRYLNKAKKAGKALTPFALRVASRVGTAGLLSLEDLEAGGEAVKAAAKILGNEAAKAVEKAISERLRKVSDERAALEAFRETLSQVAGVLSERGAGDAGTFPLVFIVDELDRCRPPFALGIIERIKHLFSVPGVCFVLVTNLPQLEQAAQGAYGTSFDAHTYLEKFYHLRVVLPEGRDRQVKQGSTYVAHLWRSLGIEFPDARTSQLVQREIQALAEGHNLSLRQLERVMTHVALVRAAARPDRLLSPPMVAGLCVMRQTHPDLYSKAKVQGLTWEEVINFLRPPAAQVKPEEWTLDWWKYATGADLPEEKIRQIAQSVGRYHLDNPKDLIPFTADYIDELVQ